MDGSSLIDPLSPPTALFIDMRPRKELPAAKELLELYRFREHFDGMLDDLANHFRADTTLLHTTVNYPWLATFSVSFYGQTIYLFFPGYEPSANTSQGQILVFADKELRDERVNVYLQNMVERARKYLREKRYKPPL